LTSSAASIRIGLSALGLIVLTALAAWFGNLVDPPRKIARIGYLSPAWPSPDQAAFEQRLRFLGYRIGESVSIDYEFSEGRDDRLDALAARLRESRVDVIVALSPEGARAAQRATRTIPIVFVSVSDPVGMGLVSSLARPGGNITGIANMPADLNLKRLEVLKDAMPDLERIAILIRPANPNSRLHLPSETVAAAQLGLDARVYNVDGLETIDAVFSAMVKDRMQAVLAIQDSMLFAKRQRIMDAAIQRRLPVIADSLEYAEANALIAYGVTSYRNLLERAASYVDKILRGAKPSALPIDQPMNIELAINLKVAKELGIDIPRSMLDRANKLLE
jgi:putative ABC transport system substrate-binding protein